MVKEYEMKKAASAYSRTKQDKSGVVDPLKLHSYKYNDDIFKRMAITPDGKNHGMMMFIDWSGSMGDKMTSTIHQLMNLTMFCQKVIYLLKYMLSVMMVILIETLLNKVRDSLVIRIMILRLMKDCL